MGTEYDAALLLIAKLREFTSTELDADERGLFARLLAPGIAQAYPADDDTTGFAMTEPVVEPLPPALAAALRDSGVRVVDFEDFGGFGGFEG